MFIKHVGFACSSIVVACLVFIVVFGVISGSAQAAPEVRYVTLVPGCGGSSPCYNTIQAAVDAAQPGDEIRVAAGTYSGINNQGGLAQVVYIDKSLTIRGGYTTSNWSASDPDTNVTELNALTLGRVVYVTGVSTTLTLEGLQFNYGDSTGLGGHEHPGFNDDAGGGVYVNQASITIDQCTIGHNYSPSNGYGGGLYLRDGNLEMTETVVEMNEAGNGGGVFLYQATTNIHSNTIFHANRVSAIRTENCIFTLSQSRLESNEDGISLSAFKSQVVIEGNVISGTINGSGVSVNGGGRLSNNTILANEHAGLSISDGDFAVMSNEIAYNSTDPGVVIDPLWGGDVTLQNNHIHHNDNTHSACYGAGVYIETGPLGLVKLTGNLIEDNFAGENAVIPSHGYGGGVYLSGDNILLDSNIIRNNTAFGFIWAGSQYWGGYGGGVYINDDPTLINNVIAGNVILAPDATHFHAPGIYVKGGSPELIHNTIAQNTGSDGVGLYVTQDAERSQVQLFNTIIVSHTIGIYAPGEDAENIAVADGILWSGNISNTWGSGTFFLSNETTGNPAFIDPVGGDYHIQATSDAVDQGVDTEVIFDIDGEARLGAPDLGADEYFVPGAFTQIFLPIVNKDQGLLKQ
jgi:hypothetical protein